MNNIHHNPQQRPPQMVPPHSQGPPGMSYQVPQQGQGASNPNKVQAGNYQFQVNPPTQAVASGNMNHHNQLFQQYANSNNPQYNNRPLQSPQGYPQTQPIYFPPPHPQPPSAALMPPPQLRQQRDHDETGDPSKSPNTLMHQSQNQNQNEVRDILWGEQEQANAFWEQKFFLIYEKFEWFGSRFEMLKSEYINLSEQLLTVDSEEDWNQLKHHHEEFAEKLEEMFQELIAVADQNQQLINQRLEEDDGVWERRYHELLSNFKALQEKTSTLEVQNQDLKQNPPGSGEPQQQEQNYPELLSHYRNLEQEYEKLYNAYNKLQQEYDIVSKSANPQSNAGPSLEDFQNMRMEYQRTLETIHNENEGLKAECQGFYEQNEHMRQQLNMQAQAFNQAEQLSRAVQEKEEIAMSLNAELEEWKKRYQSIEGEFSEMIEKERQRSEQIVLQMDKEMQVLRQQAKTKESQYSVVAKKLQDELRAHQQMAHDHHEELTKTIKIQTDKHNRQRATLQKQLQTLQHQYESLMKQSGEKDLTRYQIESQQKRIFFLKDENEQLVQEIKGKNQQLSSLRNISLQVATYENILEQYKALQKEKLGLEETSRKQHSELLQSKKKVNELQHQFVQYKSLTSSSGLKSSSNTQLKQLQSDLAHQVQVASKLQSQVHKYKQLIESKQTYIHDLEEQNSKITIKIDFQQRLLDGAKADHQNQILTLQRKLESLEKRNKTNELEFRKQIVENYEREIKQLRHSNEEKLKKIKRLEDDLSDINTKSTHLQRFSSTHHSQLTMLQNKINSLETNNTDLLSKLTLSRTSIEALQQQLSSIKQKQTNLRAQMNSYTIQIEEADNLIKSKNGIIVQYENQVQEFVEKVTALEGRIDGERKERFDRVKKYEEEIEKLKDQLYNTNNNSSNVESKRNSFGNNRRYSSSYGNRYLTFGTKEPVGTQQRNEEIVKMQNTIIEQMNEENSKLRSEVLELTKKINSLESLSRVIPALIQQQQSIKNSPSKSKINVNMPAQRDVGLVNTYVEERLMRFNERLESCIHDNELIAVRDVDLTASQRIANNERERRELQIAYEKQIRALRDQVKSLTEQLSQATASASAEPNGQGQKLTDSDLKEFDKYDIMNEQTQKSTQQQLEFLRAKLTTQQKTNSALIKLNEHLKKQLQESFQKSSHSTTEYYKLQWKQTEKFLQQEKQKNKKLTDQNKRLKHENLEHDTKLMKEYELKIFNTELELKELQRQNTHLKMLKTKIDNQKANLLHDVNVYSADIETMKSSTQAKLYQYEKITGDLKEKCSTLERQLYEASHIQKLGLNGNSRLVHSNDNLRFSNSNSKSRKIFA